MNNLKNNEICEKRIILWASILTILYIIICLPGAILDFFPKSIKLYNFIIKLIPFIKPSLDWMIYYSSWIWFFIINLLTWHIRLWLIVTLVVLYCFCKKYWRTNLPWKIFSNFTLIETHKEKKLILKRTDRHRGLDWKEINLKKKEFKRITFKLKAKDKNKKPFIDAGILFARTGAPDFFKEPAPEGTILFHVENFDPNPDNYYYAYRPGPDVHNLEMKELFFVIEVLRDERNWLQFKVNGNLTEFKDTKNQLFDTKCPYFEKI